MLNGFGVVVNALGMRVKPYLPQICGTILWRLNNKAAKVRQQAADLISRIASVMHTCGEVSLIPSSCCTVVSLSPQHTHTIAGGSPPLPEHLCYLTS